MAALDRECNCSLAAVLDCRDDRAAKLDSKNKAKCVSANERQ